MAEGVTANAHRRRLAAAMAGGPPVKPPHYIAFGDGGHDGEGDVISVNADALGLTHELIRKAVGSLTQEDDYSVTAFGRLEKGELDGAVISEVAAFDEDGNLLGLCSFKPRPKEPDESYTAKITLKY